MNNLAARILTALVGVVVIISGIIYDSVTMAVIMFAIMQFCLWEFFLLTRKAEKRTFTVWGMLFASLIFILFYLRASSQANDTLYYLVPVSMAALMILALFRKEKTRIVTSIAISIFGTVYIALPMSFMSEIAFLQGQYEYELIIGVLFMLWFNDSGAYFVGKAFGKRKLAPNISPKKTWEGAIGGFFFALIISTVFAHYFGIMSLTAWLGLGAIVSVFGTIGDLIESMFKRTLAIKDSGKILPGHGGFLDRFDGLFLAMPFATLYIHLVI